MRVLITGAKGQLGQELVKALLAQDNVVTGIDVDQLDITDGEATARLFEHARPELVIHAAAWTNVDEAARQPEAALKVNGQGTRNVALATQVVGARLLYISTNEVFAGDSDSPYIEESMPHPINAYGASKLAGEESVRGVLPAGSWAVVRTSWLYGPTSTRNFPHKIIQVADDKGELTVVDDEVSTPTYVPDLVEALVKVVDQQKAGVLHLVNEGSASRYDWAKMVLEETGRNNIPIHRGKLAEYQRASSPPPHAILSNIRAKRAGVVLPEWQESMERYAECLPKRQ